MVASLQLTRKGRVHRRHPARNRDADFSTFQSRKTVFEQADRRVIRHALARSEGILAGGTGGAVLHVLRDIAAAAYGPDDNLVAVLPDHGSRYSDTQFDKEWLSVRGIDVPELFTEADPETTP